MLENLWSRAGSAVLFIPITLIVSKRLYVYDREIRSIILPSPDYFQQVDTDPGSSV